MKVFLYAVCALLILTVSTNAAKIRVGPTSTGSASGADWNNLASWNSTFVRGNEYVMAGGGDFYNNRTMSIATNGSQYITIRAANSTLDDAETGWSSSYANQVVIRSNVTFTTGYWVFDGTTRDRTYYWNSNSYGIQITNENVDCQIKISAANVPVNSILISNIYVRAIIGSLPGSTIRRYAIDTDNGNTQASGLFNRGIVLSGVLVSGSNNPFFMRLAEGSIMEYCYNDGAVGNAANHGEVVNLYFGSDNTIVRYCHFKNSFTGAGGDPSGGGTAVIAVAETEGCEIYGNIFQNFQVGNCVVGFGGSSLYQRNMKFYNNLSMDSASGAAGVEWGTQATSTNNVHTNNVWINCVSVSINNGTHDYNSFSGGSALGEANGQSGLSTSVYQLDANGIYTLTNNTSTRIALATGYNAGFDGSALISSRGPLQLYVPESTYRGFQFGQGVRTSGRVTVTQ